MILLRKRLTRTISVELKQGRPEPLILTLYPTATLGFRHPRQRKEYLLDLRSAYLMATMREGARLFAERQATRRRAKKTHP